jgi:serine/threonine protein kinase
MSRPPLAPRKASSEDATHRPNIGLTLADRTSSGSRRSSEYGHTRKGLRPGEKLDTEGIAGRPIFIIRDATGTPVAVRKVAHETDTLPGHFAATQNEAVIYRQLSTTHSWRDHILPYRNAVVSDDTVIIDFDWIEGEDVERYLTAHPDQAVSVIRQVIMQLRWLAQQGYIHGDVKLDNFYRTADGRILLLDFGRAWRITYGNMITETGAVSRIVRPYYPEVAEWLVHGKAVEEHAHIAPLKDKLAEIYLKTVSMLVPKQAGRRSSNSRKSRKSTSSNRKTKSRRTSSN